LSNVQIPGNPLESTAAPLSEAEQIHGLRLANEQLRQVNQKLSEAQAQLMQSEKMASIGQLAAGVAHEINNPIGYIFSNFGTLEKYVGQLFRMLAAYEDAERAISDRATAERLSELREELELAYLKEDIPALMSESREGIERVRKIVQDLKDFSRVDARKEWEWANLHRGIDSTLNIVNNEIKYRAEVIKKYGDIPDVECLPSELNQVFLNLLVNAAHAIRAERGTITIRTIAEGEHVVVEVQDDGCGIAPEDLPRVFDPFFTTKPVGKGTGLGLSLSYGIVQKHHGQIEVQTRLGHGTTFKVRVPVRQPRPGPDGGEQHG